MEFSYGIAYQTSNGFFSEQFEADFLSPNVMTECVHGPLILSLRLGNAPRRIALSVSNQGTDAVKLQTATAFSARFEALLHTNGAGDLQYYTDWDHIWHAAGMTSADPADDSLWNLKRTRAVYNGGLVRKSDGMGVAMAFETPHRYESSLRFEEGRATALEYVEKMLAPGESLSIDVFRISDCDYFARALSSLHEQDASRKRIENIRDYFGYNTWEAFGADITPEIIARSLDAIEKTPLLREHIRYFILDDGWQMALGDWQENERFADVGMKAIADSIRAAGFIPGIWTAPFIAAKESRLLAEHPEMFVKMPDGQCVPTSPKKSSFVLDITHPVTKAFVADLYRTLYAWGYRYFKTDFLKDALQPMIHGNPEFVEGLIRYDMSITPEEAMNEINRIIRDALGEDSFWMGCGTQLTTNCDLMDASRTGGDISPRWSRVPLQAAGVTWRLLCNGHRFLADPDFTVLSSHATLYPEGIKESWRAGEDKPYVLNAFSGPLFNENEARTWLSFVILSGGLVNLSDCLYALKPLALDMLRVVYQYAGGPGFLPVDADKTLPRIFTRPCQGKTLVGVFNWDDEDAVITVPFGGGLLAAPTQAENIWTGEIVSIGSAPLTVKLGARTALVLQY